MDPLGLHESYFVEAMLRILWILLAAVLALLVVELVWISILTVDALRAHRRVPGETRRTHGMNPDLLA